MKETKTAKGGLECPTLLHYLARVLMRKDPSLTTFIEEMPNIEAAARGESFLIFRQVPDYSGTSQRSLGTDHPSNSQRPRRWPHSCQGRDQTSEAIERSTTY